MQTEWSAEGPVRAPHRRMAELPRGPWHARLAAIPTDRDRGLLAHRAAARVAVQSIVSWCGLKGANEVERRVFLRRASR